MNQNSDTFDKLPDAIVERLRARDRAVTVLTPEVDRAVLRAAEAQFNPRPSIPAVRRWYFPAAAAAAAAVIAILATRPFDAERSLDTTADQASMAADDVDGSGRVDILDAFALARAREDDSNATSQARIDSLAGRIVSLSEGIL